MSTGSARKPPSARRNGLARVAAMASAAALAVVFGALAQVNPLPPDRAFHFSARMLDAQTVEARFTIAEGYYLYRDKIHFAVEPTATGLSVPPLPNGAVKEDPFFGRVETYRGGVVVNLALKAPKPGQNVVIAAESQGCADIGICYPPTVQRVTVPIPEGSIVPPAPSEAGKKTWFN